MARKPATPKTLPAALALVKKLMREVEKQKKLRDEALENYGSALNMIAQKSDEIDLLKKAHREAVQAVHDTNNTLEVFRSANSALVSKNTSCIQQIIAQENRTTELEAALVESVVRLVRD